ncbi:hypothetical protein JOB18_015446 [Solea senegalensis]|uniref:Uncharacterized protein n=1 Tax=Solea senegalensis TaxID=28829 RepID=A0AAV6SK60_SOLSE|nr:hypothetical protein JOB18_015446 [Solea senegalensis]
MNTKRVQSKLSNFNPSPHSTPDSARLGFVSERRGGLGKRCRFQASVPRRSLQLKKQVGVNGNHSLVIRWLSSYPSRLKNPHKFKEDFLLQQDSPHSAGMSSFHCDQHLVGQRLASPSQITTAVANQVLPELLSVAWI